MAHKIEFPDEEFPLLGSVDSSGRAEGVHVTDVIMDWMWTMGFAERREGEMDADARRTIERGFRWEDALVLAYRGELAPRVEPLQVDGIWMSPDGFRDGVVEEFKSTKKSSRGWREASLDDPKWLYWTMQLKSYCYGLQATRGRWRVFFECGDYSKGAITPREYDATVGVEFSKAELVEHWNLIRNHLDTMEARNVVCE